MLLHCATARFARFRLIRVVEEADIPADAATRICSIWRRAPQLHTGFKRYRNMLIPTFRQLYAMSKR